MHRFVVVAFCNNAYSQMIVNMLDKAAGLYYNVYISYIFTNNNTYALMWEGTIC